MESIYTELALYGSKDECARTDHVYFPISEVCDGTVSLTVTEWVNLSKKGGKGGVFQGLAGLLQGVPKGKAAREHLIGCRGVKLFLLKYVTITNVTTATVTTVTITTVTI